MRTRLLLTMLVIVAALAACSTEQVSTLVAEDGQAPYYTSLADALNAAAPDQYVVAEFYTDW